MEFPELLKVGGHEIKVLYPYNFRERADNSAQCDKSLNELRINDEDGCGNKRPESNTGVDFLHELLHMIDKIYCNRKIENLGHGVEEEIVCGLSEGLYQVLSDNKLSF